MGKEKRPCWLAPQIAAVAGKENWWGFQGQTGATKVLYLDWSVPGTGAGRVANEGFHATQPLYFFSDGVFSTAPWRSKSLYLGTYIRWPGAYLVGPLAAGDGAVSRFRLRTHRPRSAESGTEAPASQTDIHFVQAVPYKKQKKKRPI